MQFSIATTSIVIDVVDDKHLDNNETGIGIYT